ncbi:TPA: hypothetical protein MK869_004663, partial [Salmonella enterica]|nr:hypothetical protein [Salmonella enterica]
RRITLDNRCSDGVICSPNTVALKNNNAPLTAVFIFTKILSYSTIFTSDRPGNVNPSSFKNKKPIALDIKYEDSNPTIIIKYFFVLSLYNKNIADNVSGATYIYVEILSLKMAIEDNIVEKYTNNIFSVLIYFSVNIKHPMINMYVPMWMHAESIEVTAMSDGKAKYNIISANASNLFVDSLYIKKITVAYIAGGIIYANSLL